MDGVIVKDVSGVAALNYAAERQKKQYYTA
jgi:hypothetical protein